MTFDVHTHVRIERVLGIVHVGRSMSVCVVQCQTEHVLATRACSLNSGVRKAIAQKEIHEACARARHQGRMSCVPRSKSRNRSTSMLPAKIVSVVANVAVTAIPNATAIVTAIDLATSIVQASGYCKWSARRCDRHIIPCNCKCSCSCHCRCRCHC